ncbi:hypothetical protein CspeluHIS016_0701730 [Cutaneotrichosporon spelunceum]|uniref:Uncharacterized protein n=1 Tax=Cutaneotrichosporon spelunceum TaxID=1672016 RepID=A0AAD3TYB8_9TREE|nr:hypothetical protein CspeluHIS016_0701730 [Cutaneotrichosporon spelunceum]
MNNHTHATHMENTREAEQHIGRMNNDHTPNGTRMSEHLPAPAAQHHCAGERKNDLAVPKRFPDFSRTPDLFRHTPA